MQFTCQCCQLTEEFESPDIAFQAGWDCEPFVRWTTCPLCPYYYVASHITERHDPYHRRWAEHGRPPEFSLENCVPIEDHLDEDKLRKLAARLSVNHEVTLKRILSRALLSHRSGIERAFRRLEDWTREPTLASRWETMVQ